MDDELGGSMQSDLERLFGRRWFSGVLCGTTFVVFWAGVILVALGAC